MGTTEGVKGAWRVNFFIFLLTGSQSVLLPWTPIILKSAGIKAAATGLAVGLSILFSSLGIGITLAIIRRTYSGAIRRIILLVLLLTSTIFYVTSVFLIPVENNDQSCYNYQSLINIPIDSLVGHSAISNTTASTLPANQANSLSTVPPNFITSSHVLTELYTGASKESENYSTPYIKNSTTSLSNIGFINVSKGNESLDEKSTSPIPPTQISLILNITTAIPVLTTIKKVNVTEEAKQNVTQPNEIQNITKITDEETTVKLYTTQAPTIAKIYTTNSEKNDTSKDKTHSKKKKHKSSGRDAHLIKDATLSHTHTERPKETITRQIIYSELDDTNDDDGLEEYENNSYDQDYYRDYDLQGDTNLNSYLPSSSHKTKVSSFETSMQKPDLYESYRNLNRPISTHTRRGNKNPFLGGSDIINNLQSNRNTYEWSIDSDQPHTSFREGNRRSSKDFGGNNYNKQRPQNSRVAPPLNQYIKEHQGDQTHYRPYQTKNNLHRVNRRQRRSPAIRKQISVNTSDTLINSIKSKKEGLQIDISGETVKSVASAGIVSLLIIGGILGSGIEAAVAQLWHCYAHGYDEGGVSQDILERTITHTFHLSVYPQHKRWSTVTAGCWAVLGGLMSAIGCSLGSSSGLWTGQAALHLAMALLAFFALMVIPVPYGTVDPPKTRRPLSLYLDDEVLREGLRRLAFHGWVLISGAVSSISITFGLWLIQETASTKGLGIASQACAVLLSLTGEGITLHFAHWLVSRGGVLGTMGMSGLALSVHCGILWLTSDVWVMAVAHITAGMAHGCLWLAVKHNALLLATINDQEREAWVSWCSRRGGMSIGAMLWGSWAGGLSGGVKPLFAAAGAVALLQAIAVSISLLLGRKQIRSRRRIYHTLDLDMEEDNEDEEDDDEEEDWLVKRARKEGITL